MYVKFNFNSSGLGTKSGSIKANGVGSYALVPVGAVASFEDRFNELYTPISESIGGNLATILSDVDILEDTLLGRITNLETNWLSKSELNSATYGNMISGIVENYGSFASEDALGQYYGLTLETDVNGNTYTSGFKMGALVDPSTGDADTYFRIMADKFIVGGDLGDGNFSTPTDVNGNPIPAFVIDQSDGGVPEIYFNGKVTINGMPEAVTKHAGDFASEAELLAWLAANPWFIPATGDTYRNTTTGLIYTWDGAGSFVASRSDTDFLSIIFKRSSSQPATPTGGDYDNPVPSGWSDGIPASDPSKDAQDPVWWTAFKFNSTVDYVANPPAWGTPVIASDTEVTDYMYHDSTTQPLNPTYTGDLTTVSATDAANGWYNDANTNAKWAAFRSKSEGSWSLWSVYKISGEDGAPGANGTDGTSIRTYNAGSSPFDGFTASSLFPGGPISGDQVVWATSASGGTKIYTYDGGVWGNSTALYVDGDAVITGTLAVNKLTSSGTSSTSYGLFGLGSTTFGVGGNLFFSSVSGVANDTTVPNQYNVGIAGYSASGNQAIAGAFYHQGAGYAALLGRSDFAAEFIGPTASVYIGNGDINVQSAITLSGQTITSWSDLSSYVSGSSNADTLDGYDSSYFINTSNIGSQSVSYATNATNAQNYTGSVLYASASIGTNGYIVAGGYIQAGGTFLNYSGYSLYTSTSVWVGGNVWPFTGTHYCYSQDTDITIGDIMVSDDSWVVNVNQTLVHTSKSSIVKDKRVFGVCSFVGIDSGNVWTKEPYGIVTEVLDEEGNPVLDDAGAPVTEYEIKPEYLPYIEHLINNNFIEYGSNAIGEGGINVCESNGDISNGDYICSSSVPGKGQKQDEEYLANYTVAKALEDVVWANETVGEAGVFLQDGVKCKMISCTYHSG
jgi:hypothetical protein